MVRASRSASSLRDESITDAPAAANDRAIANPIPFEAPVTSATCPSSLRSMRAHGSGRAGDGVAAGMRPGCSHHERGPRAHSVLNALAGLTRRACRAGQRLASSANTITAASTPAISSGAAVGSASAPNESMSIRHDQLATIRPTNSPASARDHGHRQGLDHQHHADVAGRRAERLEDAELVSPAACGDEQGVAHRERDQHEQQRGEAGGGAAQLGHALDVGGLRDLR